MDGYSSVPSMMFDQEIENEFRRATALRDAGELTSARELLEKLAARDATIFGVWLTLGGIQMTQADYEAAERSFSVALDLRPASELASLALFHSLKRLGRTNDAFAEMRRFLALRPESHEYELLKKELETHDGV